AFPDVIQALAFEGAVDGELLVVRDGAVAPFGDLQQRLNRKTASARLMQDYPAAILAYDLLAEGEQDVRALPLTERLERLERLVAEHTGDRLALSPLLTHATWDDLAALRADPPVGAAAEDRKSVV